MHVIACLAEGVGIRGTACVFEIDANTVLNWSVEAAERLHAFAASFLHDFHRNQRQLDARYAVLSTMRDGEVSYPASSPAAELLMQVGVDVRDILVGQAGVASLGRHGDGMSRLVEAVLDVLRE